MNQMAGPYCKCYDGWYGKWNEDSRIQAAVNESLANGWPLCAIVWVSLTDSVRSPGWNWRSGPKSALAANYSIQYMYMYRMTDPRR